MKFLHITFLLCSLRSFAIALDTLPLLVSDGSFIVLSKSAPDKLSARSAYSDWSIQPLFSNSMQTARAAEGHEIEWYVISPSFSGRAAPDALDTKQSVDVGSSWDSAYQTMLKKSKLPKAQTARSFEAPGLTPIYIEPNLIQNDLKPTQKNANLKSNTEEANEESISHSKPNLDLALNVSPNRAWPKGASLGWNMGAGFSDIEAARARVSLKYEKNTSVSISTGTSQWPKYPVCIAHLDTGYDPHHASLPLFFDARRSIGFATDGTTLEGKFGDGVANRSDLMASHGTGTLGIVAGKGRLPGIRVNQTGGDPYSGWIGVAPGATVFEVRIAGFVAHLSNRGGLSTVSMAKGIEYAVNNNADLISLSHGGIPSVAWAKAVNYAYEEGVPIFAAASDFFAMPVLGIALTPYQMAYPASYSNVIAVAGATANNRTYGHRGTLAALLPWNWKSAMLRGSYGPPWQMEHAIAAYSPNIPWAVYSMDGTLKTNLVDADGGGTSASTPQVAGAAALWLAYHANDPLLPKRGGYNAWKRVEVIREALFQSASKQNSPLYNQYYFGNGILQCNRSLDISPADIIHSVKRHHAQSSAAWVAILLSIGTNLDGYGRSASTIEDPEIRAGFDKMVATEVLQLIATDKKLQKFFETNQVDPNSPELLKTNRDGQRVAFSPREQLILLRLIAQHKGISDNLRQWTQASIDTLESR